MGNSEWISQGSPCTTVNKTFISQNTVHCTVSYCSMPFIYSLVFWSCLQIHLCLEHIYCQGHQACRLFWLISAEGWQNIWSYSVNMWKMHSLQMPCVSWIESPGAQWNRSLDFSYISWWHSWKGQSSFVLGSISLSPNRIPQQSIKRMNYVCRLAIGNWQSM